MQSVRVIKGYKNIIYVKKKIISYACCINKIGIMMFFYSTSYYFDILTI